VALLALARMVGEGAGRSFQGNSAAIHLPAVRTGGKPSARSAELSARPGIVDRANSSGLVDRGWAPATKGILSRICCPSVPARHGDLGAPILRNVRLQLLEPHGSRHAIFNSLQQ